ncbi:MAG: HAD family hydrolase [Verrucomicrobiota bacterium]|nr:HAD family hydrolase [Verrucomicrobiota bacterium]
MKRLVLFDIDGTLIRGGVFWRECFEGAVSTCFPGLSVSKVTFSGKTDGLICREVLQQAGFPEDTHARHTESIMSEYLRRAEAGITHRGREIVVLPGVHELLARLAEDSRIHLALLTGNVRAGARLKLETSGLWQWFPWGVFADDHWIRNQLSPLALARARECIGMEFAGEEVVVIGDTVHDVNCGRAIGARVIAVGTGKTVDQEALRCSAPDHYFEDFRDTSAVIAAILQSVERVEAEDGVSGKGNGKRTP